MKHMFVNVGTEEERTGERCSLRRAARDQLVTNNLLVLLDGGDMNEGNSRVLLLFGSSLSPSDICVPLSKLFDGNELLFCKCWLEHGSILIDAINHLNDKFKLDRNACQHTGPFATKRKPVTLTRAWLKHPTRKQWENSEPIHARSIYLHFTIGPRRIQSICRSHLEVTTRVFPWKTQWLRRQASISRCCWGLLEKSRTLIFSLSLRSNSSRRRRRSVRRKWHSNTTMTDPVQFKWTGRLAQFSRNIYFKIIFSCRHYRRYTNAHMTYRISLIVLLVKIVLWTSSNLEELELS